MTKFKVWLGFALFLGVLSLGLSAAEKVKSDKERIQILEKQVSALNDVVATSAADLAGEHQWAMDVNDGLQLMNNRTLDLNERLNRVENRGPVAELHQ